MFDVKKKPVLAAERFIALVHQMADELGHGTGWKATVAARLGVHPSLISQLANGTRNSVGLETINNAIETLGIDAEYFHGEFGETPDYRAFMPEPVVSERPARYPEVEEFLRTPLGATCSPHEAERLRSQAYKGTRPTEQSLQLLLLSFRAEGQRPQEDPDDASDLLAAAEERAKKRGGKVVDIHTGADREK